MTTIQSTPSFLKASGNMNYFFRYWNKQLSLNELLEEIEHLSDDNSIPDALVVFPPVNANEDVTDEDSGDDEFVTMDNLPGSLLQTQGEAVFNNDVGRNYSGASDDESDDDIPVATFMKYRKRQKRDNWVQEDIANKLLPWQDDHVAHRNAQNLDFFGFFFDSELWQMLTDYTNLYCVQHNRNGDISVDEMKCFFGVLIYSGYCSVSRRPLYWERSSDANHKIVYEAISRKRFNFIMQNLHCNDNTHLDLDNKFSKIEPLLSHLSQKFLEYAPLLENHSVDESMIPYFGRHGSKQFIRGKPIRWGYKFWMATNTKGYIEWFEPYQGSSTKLEERYKNLGLGASVVLSFADKLMSEKGRLPFHLYFDNFFSSWDLLLVLRDRGIKATGTLRENRLAIPIIKSGVELKKMERGSFEYALEKTENVLVCRWNDNNIVTMCSNTESVFPTNTVSRFSQKQKKKIAVPQPNVIKKYNQNMGGVDRADQNISLYRVNIRGKKWYFPLISHCLDMAIQNAWQLCRNNGGKMDQYTFRRSLATGILETYKKKTKPGPVRPNAHDRESSRFDGRDHLIVYQENQIRCRKCHKKVQFRCSKCDVGLHPKQCFFEFHTQQV